MELASLITSGASAQEKNDLIGGYYTWPELDYGYDFEIISVRRETGEVLRIKIKITETWMATNPNTTEFEFVITGFRTPETLQQQIDKFKNGYFENKLVDKSINDAKNEILSSSDKMTTIRKYINLPELDYGWTIGYFGGIAEDGINNLLLEINIKNVDASETRNININIFGFKNWFNGFNMTYDGSTDETLRKFSEELSTNVLLSKMNISATNKDGSTSNLNNEFRIEEFNSETEITYDYLMGTAIFSKVKLWLNDTSYIILEDLQIQYRGDDLLDTKTGLYFNVHGYITRHNGIEGELIIPNELIHIDADNKTHTITIKHIFKDAIQSSGITKITMGDSIETIGSNAFARNTLLVEVIIGNGVTHIGNSAFSNESSGKGGMIDKLTFGNNVKIIGSSAFSNNKLESIIIPDSVTMISGKAFFQNSLSGIIKIPMNVETIGAEAFSNNKLTGINMIHSPMKLKTIEPQAFAHNEITQVSVPDSLETIGGFAFSENKINNIVMGIGLIRIDVFAFWDNLLDYNTFPDFSNVPIENNLFLGDNVFFQNYING
ncbi:MAG: leucine-rich repeat protein, partial [Mycoplasmataceae bacterium]|nr:leucine-rich repeat protein [Mycoplasmataceae bacterium]